MHLQKDANQLVVNIIMKKKANSHQKTISMHLKNINKQLGNISQQPGKKSTYQARKYLDIYSQQQALNKLSSAEQRQLDKLYLAEEEEEYISDEQFQEDHDDDSQEFSNALERQLLNSNNRGNGSQKLDKYNYKVNIFQIQQLPEANITINNQLKQICCICLQDWNLGQGYKILPCTHKFHSSCIKDWLVTMNCCPICKNNVFY